MGAQEAVKEHAAEFAERVSWEASAAEEDYHGGGVDAADFLPAASRFLERGFANLESYRSKLLDIKDQRTSLLNHLTELKAINAELVQARREESQLRRAKEAGDSMAAIHHAVQQRNGHACIQLIGSLTGIANQVREANDPELETAISKMCSEAVTVAKSAYEEDLRLSLEAEGFPMAVPNATSKPKGLEQIQDRLAFLDAWQSTTTHLGLNENSDLQQPWSIAALIRDGISRYRFHFSSRSSSLSDPHHPEWAADFVFARLTEAMPFLAIIRPQADVAFANALIGEYVVRIISDMKTANDGELIRHAATVTMALELRLHGLQHAGLTSPVELLVNDEWFVSTWAAAEMSHAEQKTSEAVQKILSGDWTVDEASSVASAIQNAEETCSLLEDAKTKAKVFGLITKPVLQSVRSTLRGTVAGEAENTDFDVTLLDADRFRACCRAASLAASVGNMLNEFQESSIFYMLMVEACANGEDSGSPLFKQDVRRFQQEQAHLSSSIVRCVVDRFRNDLVPYRNCVVYGDLSAPSPDSVLSHDLSGELREPMQLLEHRLGLIQSALGRTRAANRIWREIADELDKQVFEDIFILAFAGGDQGTLEVANSSNDFLSAKMRGRILRQICFDASVLVSLFEIFTKKVSKVFQRLSEATTLLILSIAGEDEWNKTSERSLVLSVLEKLPTRPGDQTASEAATVLRENLHVTTLTPREAKEMLIIAGLLLPPLT
mmetsp:Transcript_16125/g.66553  ORF Transcript_16125/g.66553 Transcript_16125/m.66553 type:complete len:723 (-) Transcript_16125:923-3091(-)